MVLLVGMLFLLGLCVGSFLNVVIDRLPLGQDIVRGRSRCPRCGQTLKWYDLIPLLSFVFLRGRCRYCGKKISWQYPLVELTMGVSIVSGVSMVRIFPLTPLIPLTPLTLLAFLTQLTLMAILIAIAVIDLKHGLIPDKLVYPAVAVALSVQLLASSPKTLLTTLLASVALYSLFFILHSLFGGRGMGGGDVKLAFLVGLITGWPNMTVAIFSAFLTGALVSVILMLVGKKKFGETVPFGPFLVIGTYLALFWGSDIMNWYLGLL